MFSESADKCDHAFAAINSTSMWSPQNGPNQVYTIEDNKERNVWEEM